MTYCLGIAKGGVTRCARRGNTAYIIIRMESSWVGGTNEVAERTNERTLATGKNESRGFIPRGGDGG